MACLVCWSVVYFLILFTYDTNMFITGNDISDMCHRLNGDLAKVQQLLCQYFIKCIEDTSYDVYSKEQNFW